MWPVLSGGGQREGRKSPSLGSPMCEPGPRIQGTALSAVSVPGQDRGDAELFPGWEAEVRAGVVCAE